MARVRVTPCLSGTLGEEQNISVADKVCECSVKPQSKAELCQRLRDSWHDLNVCREKMFSSDSSHFTQTCHQLDLMLLFKRVLPATSQSTVSEFRQEVFS